MVRSNSVSAAAKIAAGFSSVLAILLSVGCSYTAQPAKVRAPFTPPAPRAATATPLPDAPPVTLQQPMVELSPALRASMQPSDGRRKADALVQRANLRFQRGKGLYQASEYSKARDEFDAAVDLMLEAGSGLEGPDRQDYGRKLDEMVEAIHRFDLAGLGASDTQEGKFDPAPLEDILQMTFPV